MHEPLSQIARLVADSRTALDGLGLYACVRTLDIRHVPFSAPCLILVLAGRKVIYTPAGPIVADAGELLAVPGPAAYDLRNETDSERGTYRALVVPFEQGQLRRLREMHTLPAPDGLAAPLLHYAADRDLLESVLRYLAAGGRDRLRSHRLLELLLILAESDPRLLGFSLVATEWRSKVQALLAGDLAREWELADVCRHLAVGESTLRRHLRAEDTSFRDLLREARLGTALMRLQQSDHPVQRVAYDCGYRSVSRFTANFRQRFGLTPTELRAGLTEKGH